MAVQVKEKALHLGSFPIKNGVTVPPGALVTLDSNQQVILADQSTNVTCQAFAVFDDGNGAASLSRTGTAQLNVRATLYRQGIVQGASGLSSLTIGGVVYLGASGAYTQSMPGAGSVQAVGEAIDTDTASLSIGAFQATSGGGGGGAAAATAHFLVSQTEASLPNSTVATPNTDGTGQTNVDDTHIWTVKAAKLYADSVAAGLIVKSAVDLATTGALPAGTYDNGTAGVGATFTVTATGTLTIDGVLTILNHRILVKDQADQTQNGIYVVTTAGATGVNAVLTRATDSDTGAELLDGLYGVTLGTANAGKFFYLTNSVAPTIGTDNLVYQQFSTVAGGGSPGVQAGSGLKKQGQTLSVIGDGTGLFNYLIPAQITGDQNNYNPPGLSTAALIEISSDAARNITGLAGGAIGRMLALVNVGGSPITLKNQSGLSSAVNRFKFSADIVLQPSDGVLLIYDPTPGVQAWAAIGTVQASTVPTGAANPTGTIGATAVNGSLTTYMRSDGAPAFNIAGLTGKTTPVSADTLALADSAASNALKSLTYGNLITALNGLYDALGAAAAVTRASIGANIYDMGFNFVGKPGNSQNAVFIATRAVTLPASLTGSQAKALTASTGNVSFDIQVNGSSKGSVTFNATATGSFTFSSQVVLAAGDIVKLVAPSSADSTLADIGITLVGTY